MLRRAALHSTLHGTSLCTWYLTSIKQTFSCLIFWALNSIKYFVICIPRSQSGAGAGVNESTGWRNFLQGGPLDIVKHSAYYAYISHTLTDGYCNHTHDLLLHTLLPFFGFYPSNWVYGVHPRIWDSSAQIQGFWRNFGISHGFRFLYCGVSAAVGAKE